MTTASRVSIHRERKSVARTVAVSVAVVTTRIRRHVSRAVRAARTGRTVRAVTEDASVRMASSKMVNRMVRRMASSRSRTANNRISGDSPEP